MSNAKDTAPTGEAGALVPEKFLEEGEVVILAIKPSLWFILLNAFPAVAAAAAVATAGYAVGAFYQADIAPAIILLLCVALALGRLLVCCFQWAGRLYVLTNVRIMRVRGLLRADVFQAPLRQVEKATLLASGPERFLGVASLFFEVSGSQAQETAWLHIAQPAEVYEIVQDAIRRLRR